MSTNKTTIFNRLIQNVDTLGVKFIQLTGHVNLKKNTMAALFTAIMKLTINIVVQYMLS